MCACKRDRDAGFDDIDFAAYRRAFEFMIDGNPRGVFEMDTGQKEAASRVLGKRKKFEMNMLKSASKRNALGEPLAVHQALLSASSDDGTAADV